MSTEGKLTGRYEMERGGDLVYRWTLVIERGGVRIWPDDCGPTELAAALLAAAVEMARTKCHVCGVPATVRSRCTCDGMWTCVAHRSYDHTDCAECGAEIGTEKADHIDDGLHIASVHWRCGADHRARLAQKVGAK